MLTAQDIGGGRRVLSAFEVAQLLKLDQQKGEDRAALDQVESVHRLVKRHGLRPIGGVRPYRFTEREVWRWADAQTEAFGVEGEPTNENARPDLGKVGGGRQSRCKDDISKSPGTADGRELVEA